MAPGFFGYEKEISAELKRRGAQVDFILDRPFASPLVKAITKVWRDSTIVFADFYYRKKLKEFNRETYDLIFVINGQTLSESTLKHWKRAFPNATFVLYAWDSFRNRKKIIGNLEFFDSCFTFDPEDAHKYSINFRPLFFSTAFSRQDDYAPDYDISFVGTAHTDRYKVISTVLKRTRGKVSFYAYLFLQAKWVFYLYKIFKPEFRRAAINEFHFQPLSKEAVKNVFERSKIILDVEHYAQTGLTIRTFEALGAGKKLITTNSQISNYEFFSENNICIIDRNNPVIPDSFLRTHYNDLPAEIYGKYSIAGWLDQILQISCK
ncbi:hypothetical protein C7440_0239 [Pusillimonas noertemannii]|uniref:Spore protein YkvP/CgeB glycosyl transferase-like domain-containing protein n=2 Tax=Pusillimonas noertemannii TaxID=305977 RepID=A0A2U1CPP4_9BURK|nr:hypothetical protein C7440_0239 [Pusillimonas noertemannii]